MDEQNEELAIYDDLQPSTQAEESGGDLVGGEIGTPTTAVSPPAEEIHEPGTLGQRLIMFVIMAISLGLDQWTKNIVETNLRLGEIYAPFPNIEQFFRIFHVSNTGAAFGLLPSGGPVFAAFAVIVSILIIYYNYTLPKGEIGLRIVLGLLLGGALGNFIDRVRLGHVTDFLDFGPWPVFNIADMSVVAGVIVMGWFTYQEFLAEQAANRAAAEAAAQKNSLQEP